MMRKGFNNQIIKDDNGKLIGFCLGADFTSEHEWGINDIRNAFGMQGQSDRQARGFVNKTLHTKEEKFYGIDRRVITKVPQYLYYQELDTKQKDTVLLFFDYLYREIPELTTKYLASYELSIYDTKDKTIEDKLATAWDSRSWGIRTQGKENRKLLKELYEAIQNCDCSIFLGGGHVFCNSGLSICIASRIPQEVKDMWYESDIDAEKLELASEATGIHNYLQEKFGDTKWYALEPKWSNKNGEITTEYDVIYWLNPKDQQNNNYGWFTVEQLKEWADGKGIISVKK